MPSAGRIPGGTSSQGMDFISFQAQGEEDELFLPIILRERGSALPRQKTAGDKLPFPLAECPPQCPEMARHDQ